jgi:hypothetical protein
MTSLENSVARMAASLAAIDAAKKRVVVMDTIVNPKKMKTTAPIKKIIIKTAAPKPAEAPTETKPIKPIATTPKAVERIAIVAPGAPKPKKTSNLSKLIKGKRFDFS